MKHLALILCLTLAFACAGRAQSSDSAYHTPHQWCAVTDHAIEQDSTEATSDVMVPFRSELVRAAHRHQVPAALLAAFCQEESAFDPWAERTEPAYLKNTKIKRLSRQWSKEHGGLPTALTEQTGRATSMGLMQPMGEVAREQGYDSMYLSSLFEPFNSIDQGATLLRTLLNRYGRDTLAAISAYNQGSAHKSHGTFDNARYVYRVNVAWRHYSHALNYGQNTNSRSLAPYGVAPGGFMVRASIVQPAAEVDTALHARDTLGEGANRHGDTARYGAIKGALLGGAGQQPPASARDVGFDNGGISVAWYIGVAALYCGVLGYFAYDLYRNRPRDGHPIGMSRRGDGLLHG